MYWWVGLDLGTTGWEAWLQLLRACWWVKLAPRGERLSHRCCEHDGGQGFPSSLVQKFYWKGTSHGWGCTGCGGVGITLEGCLQHGVPEQAGSTSKVARQCQNWLLQHWASKAERGQEIWWLPALPFLKKVPTDSCPIGTCPKTSQ